MRLPRLVPLFILLVTAVSLISPAYAANSYNPRSNAATVFRQNDGLLSTVTGTATIMFTANGKTAFNKTNPTPLVLTFTFTPSQGGKVFVPAPTIVRTDVPANGASVVIQFTQSNVQTTCSNNVANTEPNIPVTIACKANNGVVVAVQVTTNYQLNG
ncbi:MAG TPA: hypothetical protein VK503_01885 [Candidatus Bathyarchaeia archaeon]|nr:hypothetical protein [Candidatus Bathyarchaeia archaeon]